MLIIPVIKYSFMNTFYIVIYNFTLICVRVFQRYVNSLMKFNFTYLSTVNLPLSIP